MTTHFETIGLFGRTTTPQIIETLKTTYDYLTSLKKEVFIEQTTAQALEDDTVPTLTRAQLVQQCELLIIVGGDGSMLHAAHATHGHAIPLIGINRGRLGFLTDILPTELNKIKEILNGNYQLEKRFLLNAVIEHDGQPLGKNSALNEVAMIPDTIPHMNEFEIYINDHFVCSQHSDGLIIATPTGSTAYALSGGGPILHPHLNALVIVPMFPHSLSNRPIVIDGESTITIVISPFHPSSPRVTCDGQEAIHTPPGSLIHIKKESHYLQLLHPTDYDYYASLRSKLYWGRKLGPNIS